MNEVARNDVVLVVDDSADALSLINEALEPLNMDILVALEGRQAIKIAQRIKPDIILMDAIMPNMDGFETCRQLKSDASLASVPVLFMTGLSETDDIVRGLECGGVDYLVKPIEPNELIARMKVHLNNARLTSSARHALDSTGQHLLTVTGQGQIHWATPESYALLAKAAVTESRQQNEFAGQLRRWLEHEPPAGLQLSLQGIVYPLSVRIIGRQSNGLWLLKLLDGKRLSGAELLKKFLNLTLREAEVLYWIANGKTNRETGEILAVSPRTVNKHLEQIFPKLGVENRTSAAGVALRLLAAEGDG
ncbi:DNA-binding response regulator [Gynuella sunshinyii]|uniref:Response regulator containing a CheY-like receiver domain and a GGDEF domain n=1 Tax=Gynuella sunshinyii YC6258 TaxID=1445510 RepID=A0A0C5VQ12_9GAMM|nr:DNA-binding response regulator [Gynuella sunshinyii]AJQ96692.1 response regulator containing a CheY-like receiver domain and a GGDEF domain [Gynuella sunshinyii YC6258]